MKTLDQQAARRRLQTAIDRLQPDVEAITDQTQNPSGGQGTSDLSNAPMHLADGGTDEYLHELNATLLENEEYLLTELRTAIKRLDEGVYGVCQSCEQQIADERLKALPQARLCFRCAAKSDSPRANLNNGRPQRPADTLADEEEMEIKRRDKKSSLADMATSQDRPPRDADRHAAGTPGGGSATGGLAGMSKGDGSPDIHDLEDAMGSGEFDARESDEENRQSPTANRRGSAVSGTPATRR